MSSTDFARILPKQKLGIYLSADVAQALEKRHYAERLAAADRGADLRDVSRSAIVEAALRTYFRASGGAG